MPENFPAIQAVLFDYGVVLSGPPDPASWARMLDITELGEGAFSAAYWSARHDYDRGFYTGTDYWHAVARHAGIELTAVRMEALLAADNELWTQVNRPMVDWALRLQAAGTTTGILSNLGDAMTEGVLARQTWLGGFDFLLWSHSVKLAKPDPEIYRHALDGLGLPASSILFIDDRANNAAAGLAAGMQVVHYTTQDAFEREMEARNLAVLWRTGRLAAK